MALYPSRKEDRMIKWWLMLILMVILKIKGLKRNKKNKIAIAQ